MAGLEPAIQFFGERMADETDKHDYPGAFTIALDSWKLAFHAALAMPVLFLSTLVALAAIQIGFSWNVPGPADTTDGLPAEFTGFAAWEMVRMALELCVYTPLTLSIYRFILLDDEADGILSYNKPNALRFLVWQAAMSLLPTIPILSLMPLYPAAILVVLPLVFYVAIKLSFVLPSVAVGATAAPLAESWKRTDGHFFGIFLSALATMLPVLVLTLLLGAISFIPLIEYVTTPLAMVILVACGPAVMAQLYGYIVMRKSGRPTG